MQTYVSSLVIDLINQRTCPHSQPPHSSNRLHLNLDPHVVAMAQRHFGVPHGPDARRRPRHDQGPALQRGALREEGDGLGHAEDHLRGARVLHHGAVVDGLDAQGVRVRDLRPRDENGADGRGGVEAWARVVGFEFWGNGCGEREIGGGVVGGLPFENDHWVLRNCSVLALTSLPHV